MAKSDFHGLWGSSRAGQKVDPSAEAQALAEKPKKLTAAEKKAADEAAKKEAEAKALADKEAADAKALAEKEAAEKSNQSDSEKE